MQCNIINNNPNDASAIIIYQKKKVLLNLRSNKKKIFYANHWGLLGGAKEKNENLRFTAIREFEEETSTKIISKNLLFFNKITFNFPSKVDKIIIRNYYIYEIKNLKEFKKNFFLTEGTKSKFFNYTEIKKLNNLVPYDKFALDIFFSRN